MKKETNGLAIASMICSLCSVAVWVASIVGIVLGFVAIHQIDNDPERYEGRSFAIAGIAVGFAVLGLSLLILVFYLVMVMSILSSF